MDYCQYETSSKAVLSPGVNAGILWLASYPKSGNTWFRTFLTNFLSENSGPASIDDLSVPWGISRTNADLLCGLDTSLMLPEELSLLWPEITRRFLKIPGSPRVLKTHAALLPELENGFLFTPATAGALYLVRNPLDVCVSFSYHLDRSFDDTIEIMLGAYRRSSRSNSKIPEFVSSWHENVESWSTASEFPVLTLRYEDLLENPHFSFKRAVEFLGHEPDDTRITAAINSSRFENLQAQERQNGFSEKSPCTHTFFRKGRNGEWKQLLTSAQAKRLIDANREPMERLGYLESIG